MAHSHLIVANGTCDVYTGVGDPFLPFRDVLGMLTGDIESQYRSGNIGRDHAVRLWQLMPHTIRGLVDHGRDLVNTLVPGTALLARSTGLESVDTFEQEQLREIVDDARIQSTEQSQLFAQVAAVLAALKLPGWNGTAKAVCRCIPCAPTLITLKAPPTPLTVHAA